MDISVSPELEAQLRIRAEAEGLTVEAYLDRLLRSDQEAEDEIELLAIEGINSGEPFEAGPAFWEEKQSGCSTRWRRMAWKKSV
jgi:hypothetical protein